MSPGLPRGGRYGAWSACPMSVRNCFISSVWDGQNITIPAPITVPKPFTSLTPVLALRSTGPSQVLGLQGRHDRHRPVHHP